MSNSQAPSPACWPFYVADAALVATAFWIANHYPGPLPPWALAAATGCIALAAILGILPHRQHYQAIVRFAEANGLTDAVQQINQAELAAERIQSATAQWQGVQEHSAKTVQAAKEIGERMAAEARAFAEFMQKANDQEKASLRLEVEKLRRAEGQSVQVLVHLLDHVFALQQAGRRSGQPNLEAQLNRFQDACRDVVRRVGLTPFEAGSGEAFDPERHQLPEGQTAPETGTPIGQTLASGYSFQGQMIRRSLVLLQQPEAPEPVSMPASEAAVEEQPVESIHVVETRTPEDTATIESVEPETALETESKGGVKTSPKAAVPAAGELFQLEP